MNDEGSTLVRLVDNIYRLKVVYGSTEGLYYKVLLALCCAEVELPVEQISLEGDQGRPRLTKGPLVWKLWPGNSLWNSTPLMLTKVNSRTCRAAF